MNSLLHSACYLRTTCLLSASFFKTFLFDISFLSLSHQFVPVAFETLGPINNSGIGFIKDLVKRHTLNTGDIRETAFLFQLLSTTIQRFNAVAFRGTFGEPDTTERVAVLDSIILRHNETLMCLTLIPWRAGRSFGLGCHGRGHPTSIISCQYINYSRCSGGSSRN